VSDSPRNDTADGFLTGIRIVELADELGEYAGKVLAGLGADVVKVEPSSGEVTRTYGPFFRERRDPDSSLYFWHYNFGKRSAVLDVESDADRANLLRLIAGADVFVTSRPTAFLRAQGLDPDTLRRLNPRLITARITPFGDSGPWADYRGSDLVHLALGGVAMNCGYDPEPGGRYDTPPIAPQMWHAYHIAGEHAAMAVLGALVHRLTVGEGQDLSVSVHQAVSTNTETDVPNWVYQRTLNVRQTGRAARPTLSPALLSRTKDGRWLLPYRTYLPSAVFDSFRGTYDLLAKYGMEMDLGDERYQDADRRTEADNMHIGAATDRLSERFTFDADLWKTAQSIGLPWAPCRRPEENLAEEHWSRRSTFVEVEHAEHEVTLREIGAKWLAPEVPWRSGPRAPKLGEHTAEVLAELAAAAPVTAAATVHARAESPAAPSLLSAHGTPFALAGVRIIDLAWLLASAGGARYLSALGAEVIKVEHASRMDGYRFGAGTVPPGGRAERDAATSPIGSPGSSDPNRGGAFMEINSGKRGISLNLKTEAGREILRELVASADVVVEGFSPGTMRRMGFGYEVLRQINPRIVYVQQSGMGEVGTYGRLRSYGPTAQAITGITEMSGLPEPWAPAGFGYSFLDWFGAYNIAMAMLAGIYRQRVTGKGCWIDSSQAETGIFLTGTAVLDHQVNGRAWQRYGNRSPYKLAAPHGIFRVSGNDRWLAVSCFTDDQWCALAETLRRPELSADRRFATLAGRIAHQDELDVEVGKSLARWNGEEAMRLLQAAGVPAGVCQTAEDRCDHDPQLAHLGWTVELDQHDIGRWPVKEFPVRFGATPAYMGGVADRSGPSYGQDNDYVFGDLLGYSLERIEQLRADGII
jgi:crotonobetainyl-CoA:carnitine CoA-transferase CaiB-like acyl-CoA transferase